MSAVDSNGGQLYSALYEKRDVGGFILSGALTFAGYQTQFDANLKAGRNLASLNAISNGNTPLMLGLWEEKASKNFVARHGLTAAQFQTEYTKHLADGYLTRAVSGCDNGASAAAYAGLWSK